VSKPYIHFNDFSIVFFIAGAISLSGYLFTVVKPKRGKLRACVFRNWCKMVFILQLQQKCVNRTNP
jgi:hypothetical protein